MARAWYMFQGCGTGTMTGPFGCNAESGQKRNHDPDDFSRKGEPSHVSRTAASPPDARGGCATAEATAMGGTVMLSSSGTPN